MLFAFKQTVAKIGVYKKDYKNKLQGKHSAYRA